MSQLLRNRDVSLSFCPFTTLKGQFATIWYVLP